MASCVFTQAYDDVFREIKNERECVNCGKKQVRTDHSAWTDKKD